MLVEPTATAYSIAELADRGRPRVHVDQRFAAGADRTGARSRRRTDQAKLVVRFD
jgi:hypothetical protein